MTAITRTRLLILAAAIAPTAAVASIRHPAPVTPASASAEQQDSTRRVTRTSEGTVSRRPARGTTSRAGEPRAVPRDFVGADSKTCDDLCQRERRLDSLYGKDRERMPGSAQRRIRP